MGMRLDATGQSPKRGRESDHADGSCPAEVERATAVIVWTRAEVIRGPLIRKALVFEAEGKRPRAASKKRWRDLIEKDLVEAKVTAVDAVDRRKWRRLTRMTGLATARS